jgi:transcriptional regulator with XRE-family HTH domain
MDVIADGRALEAYIKRQMAASEQPHSILELSRVTGIRASTMYEWFSGARVPRTDSLARVGAALGVPASRLLDAYQQRASIEVNDAALAAIEGAVERGVATAIRRLVEDGVVRRGIERD